MNTQQPDPKASLAKARALLGQNKIREALEIVETFTQENPGDAAGWALFASVMMTVNEPAAAVATIERALALNPDNASWQVLAAQAYVISGDLDRGKSSLQIAVNLNGGKDAGVLCDAGYVFTLLQQRETANKLFTDAIQQEPEREIAHFNLGMNELALGNFEAAEISLDRAIELDQAPYRCKFEAMLSRAGLRKQTEDDNHVAELKSELEQSLPAYREPAVCYALAKEPEDLEQHEESFKFCKRGADIRYSTFQYDVNVDVNTFNEIIETHTSDALRALQPGTNDPSPSFVMGLPRSGTTLTDRIISSHSEMGSR